MKYEKSKYYVCGIKELGTKQWEVKSFVFIIPTKQEVEYDGYIRKLDDTHFINISYNQGKTLFIVYNINISSNSIVEVSRYQSPTNCFSDRLVYELRDKFLLSGLNDIVVVDKVEYNISQPMYPVNNPYVEIVPVKYKVGENYNVEFLLFSKKQDSTYRVTVTDSFLHYKEVGTINYENITLDSSTVTESNLPSITSYNEKNLYSFKSNNKYYIQVETTNGFNRTTRFRDKYFGNLSRRYLYNIVEFDTVTQKFSTLYRSSDSVIYYIHQKDFTPPTYLYKIERRPGNYLITVSTLEDNVVISSKQVGIESNFQLIAVTHVRDEIVVLEGRDVVKDNFIGMEILVTNIHTDNTNQLTINQSKIPINLFCTKPGNERSTVGLDLKGVVFYDTEITFATYCGSRRYDMNFVTVNIVSNSVFTATSKRQPFTYSFINHPVCRVDDGYVKTGLVKSRYELLYPQTSVIYSTGGDLNELSRVDTNLTLAYFSKYRQSLKSVDKTVFVGDLSLGYDYREKKYIIPLQEPTDTNLTDFKEYIQTYCISYSPELLKNIYIVKRGTRYPTNILMKGLSNRLSEIYKLPVVTLQMCKTGFDILYIIGAKYDYCNTVTSDSYSTSLVNLDTSKVRVYTTNTMYLQEEFVRELPLENFKAYGSPIFTSEDEFFGMYNVDDSNIAVLRQINPNSGIPLTQDSDNTTCSYLYEFEIYYGLEHSSLEYYGTIEYVSNEPIKLFKYDSGSKAFIYTQPIVFTTESTDGNQYDLFLYLFTNRVSIDGRLWYRFDEIYGNF